MSRGKKVMRKWRNVRVKAKEFKKGILTALAPMGELIANQRRLELKGNRELDLTTNNAILEVQETHKIRGLNRAMCEFTEKTSEQELRKEKEMEIEWELFAEREKVNSDVKIDQMAPIRFKTQMESKNLSRQKSEKITGGEMPGMGTPKEEAYKNRVIPPGKLQLGN